MRARLYEQTGVRSPKRADNDMRIRALALTIGFGVVLASHAFAQTTRPRANPVLMAASAVQPVGAQEDPASAPKAVPIAAPAPLDPIGPPTLAAVDPSAAAQTRVPGADPTRGSVTNLPLPRYVSLKSGEGNARRGPGLTHRIDWVFTRTGMPLKITAEHEHWRRIEDAEGMGGWVHFALLSGVRTVLVADDRLEFHSRADAGAPVVFAAEAGVVGRVMSCDAGWCRINIGGEKGWAPMASLWGVDPDEIIE